MSENCYEGLARDIVMFLQMDVKPTGGELYAHLNRLGREIPDWLPKLMPRAFDGVPPKAVYVEAIYRAVLASNGAQARCPEGWASLLKRCEEKLNLYILQTDGAHVGGEYSFKLLEDVRAMLSAAPKSGEG